MNKNFVLRPVVGGRYSQKDINVIGPELARIAKKLKVDEISQLDARRVKEVIETEPKSPLWKYINTSSKKALEHWVIRQLGSMIRSVRYVRVDIPNLKPQAFFEHVKDPSLKGIGAPPAKVSAVDAYDKSGIATRIADGKIKRVRQEVTAFCAWVIGANVPREYKRLGDELTEALNAFDARDISEAS